MKFTPFVPDPVQWKPHAYQKKGMKFLIEHACGALFFDPGLGKTSITLGAIKYLMRKGAIEKTLIIAPLRVAQIVWKEERDKWLDFKDISMVTLHGPKKDKLFDEFVDGKYDIALINPEGLEWLLGATKTKGRSGKTRVAVDTKRLRSLGLDTLVIDELSKFKHMGSNRFKALRQIHNMFRRRWGLTGSPAANGLMDLFGECLILDEGRTFGRYITRFRNTYFTPGYDGFSWNLQEDGAERIYERLNPLVLRASAEDNLDMPAIVTNDIKVDLPPQAAKIYEEIEGSLVASVFNTTEAGNKKRGSDTVIAAETTLELYNQCRQIAAGGLYVSLELAKSLKLRKNQIKGGRGTLQLHDAKTDALEGLIEELQGEPLLVAYEFQHDLVRIKKRFGEDVPYIGSGVKSDRVAELVKAWNHGDLPYLFGHPQSMGHGLNLQKVGHHICWYTLIWNYELYDQFVRRVYRQGNKNGTVFNHRLIARNTIEEEIIAPLLIDKKTTQADLFEALVKMSKRRGAKK